MHRCLPLSAPVAGPRLRRLCLRHAFQPQGRGSCCLAKLDTRHSTLETSPAFTLVELLVVVAIIGIVLTMAIPSIYRQINPDKASIQRAVNDIVEACRHARAQAILNRTLMEVRIRPKEGSIQIATASNSTSPIESHSVSGEAWRMDDLDSEPSASSGAGSSYNATLSPHIMIRAIRLNVDDDFTEEPEARVRFYPNGMSDEFSIVLQSEKDEYRMINLEVVTGLPSVETDPTKFVNYR